MHAETVLTPADLIWPLFVTEGDDEEPIATILIFRCRLRLSVRRGNGYLKPTRSRCGLQGRGASVM